MSPFNEYQTRLKQPPIPNPSADPSSKLEEQPVSMGGISLSKYSACTSESDTAARFQSQQREKPLSGCDLCELLLTPLTSRWDVSFSGSSHLSPLMVRGSKLQKSRCSKPGPVCSPLKVVSSLGRSHNPQVKLPWSEGIWLLKKKSLWGCSVIVSF